MDRHTQLGAALVVLAAALFVAPAVFPVQPMLTHDTGRTSTDGLDELRAEGYRVVAYENLSERGQELYVQTLERGGEYRVRLDRGAPSFEYPTQTELEEVRDRRRERGRGRGDRTHLGTVVIERPPNDDALPPSDEHVFGGVDEESGTTERELRRQALRYDLMETRTEQPPLGSFPQLIRLAAVLLAVVSLGVGGYLLSSP